MLLSMPRVDKIKKRNMQKLFVHYRAVIDDNKEIINAKSNGITTAEHLMWMCDTASSEYITHYFADGDNSKVNRWLGFIQGVIIMCGVTTIDNERNFTRNLLTEHREFL